MLAYATQSNALPSPMLVRVLNVKNSSSLLILESQAVFDSSTESIFIKSFLSMLVNNTATIFGIGSTVLTNDPFGQVSQNIDNKIYGIQTAILPYDFSQFNVLSLDIIP